MSEPDVSLTQYVIVAVRNFLTSLFASMLKTFHLIIPNTSYLSHGQFSLFSHKITGMCSKSISKPYDRYSDLARAYKEKEKESEKLRDVLAKTQDKALRKVSTKQ